MSMVFLLKVRMILDSIISATHAIAEKIGIRLEIDHLVAFRCEEVENSPAMA